MYYLETKIGCAGGSGVNETQHPIQAGASCSCRGRLEGNPLASCLVQSPNGCICTQCSYGVCFANCVDIKCCMAHQGGCNIPHGY